MKRKKQGIVTDDHYGIGTCMSELIEFNDSTVNMKKKQKGVYFLYNEDKELVYIGRSLTCIYARVRMHFFPAESKCSKNEVEREKLEYKASQIKYFNYSQISKKARIKAIEILLIDDYEPRFNILGNSNKLDPYPQSLYDKINNTPENIEKQRIKKEWLGDIYLSL